MTPSDDTASEKTSDRPTISANDDRKAATSVHDGTKSTNDDHQSDDPTGDHITRSDDTTASPQRKPAIVTIRRKSRFGRAEDITVDEANRRAKLADAMMQDFKRQIAEKIRK